MFRLSMSVTALIAILFIPTLLRAQETTGTWTAESSAGSDIVRLTLTRYDHGSISTNSSAAQLGLTAQQLNTPGQRVAFTISREAGTISFTGWMANYSGGGTFSFEPSSGYRESIERMGFTGVTDDRLMAASGLDLNLAYVREIAAAGFSNISFDKLLGFRALGISSQYAGAMRSLLPAVDTQSLISLRALGVTPEYVSGFRSAGVTDLDARNVIRLKALKVDPRFAEQMSSLGYRNLSTEELIRLKVLVRRPVRH